MLDALAGLEPPPHAPARAHVRPRASQACLQRLESSLGISIVFAVERSSRLIGSHHAASDCDVLAVYALPRRAYFSMSKSEVHLDARPDCAVLTRHAPNTCQRPRPVLYSHTTGHLQQQIFDAPPRPQDLPTPPTRPSHPAHKAFPPRPRPRPFQVAHHCKFDSVEVSLCESPVT